MSYVTPEKVNAALTQLVAAIDAVTKAKVQAATTEANWIDAKNQHIIAGLEGSNTDQRSANLAELLRPETAAKREDAFALEIANGELLKAKATMRAYELLAGLPTVPEPETTESHVMSRGVG